MALSQRLVAKNSSILFRTTNRIISPAWFSTSRTPLLAPSNRSELPADYQTSKERSLLTKQYKFPKLTSQIYVQKEEVKCYDGHAVIEPMLQSDPHKPHELHLLKKIGSVKGEPWWVRNALYRLGFLTLKHLEWRKTYSVQPNTKEINDNIWLCKHLIRVTPITFKNGQRPTEQDIGNAKLDLDTGVMEIVRPLEMFKVDSLDCFNANNVPIAQDLRPDSRSPLGRKELHADFHRRKQLCQLNKEYFPAVYDYKYDQDIKGVLNPTGRPDTSVKEDDVTEN